MTFWLNKPDVKLTETIESVTSKRLFLVKEKKNVLSQSFSVVGSRLPTQGVNPTVGGGRQPIILLNIC